MTWKNNSQKHSLAAKGVKTSYDSSGIWFESRGILRDTPLLDDKDIKMHAEHLRDEYDIPTDDIIDKLEHTFILPIKKVDESVKYIYDNSKGNIKRHTKMLIDISKTAKFLITKKLRTTKNLRVKEELHYSYNQYDNLIKKLEAKL